MFLRISEKEVSQVEAEYAAIVSVCDAKKSEWTKKMNDFRAMYDERYNNFLSKLFRIKLRSHLILSLFVCILSDKSFTN